jgi:hypothetical protein
MNTAMKEKLSKKDIIRRIRIGGYTVTEDFDYVNQKTKLAIQDIYGYRYRLTVNRLLWGIEGKDSEFSKFNKLNPYTEDNIILWMKENNHLATFVSASYRKYSGRDIKLICNKGHSFTTSLGILQHSSPNTSGCTICSGRQVSSENSFGDKFPEMLSEWSPNNTISPYDISWGNSDIKVYWTCMKGHSDYPCTISNKRYGKGCPSCGGKNTAENNIGQLFPELLSEWDYNKNKTPYSYAPHSNEKVWWICSSCNLNYEAYICNRTKNKPTGCPNCKAISSGEDFIASTLSQFNLHYIFQKRFPECKDKNTLPFDFYIPALNTAIEFQGIQHYTAQKYFGGDIKLKDQRRKDKIKKNYCNKNKIKLIIIPYWDFNNINKILSVELKMGG